MDSKPVGQCLIGCRYRPTGTMHGVGGEEPSPTAASIPSTEPKSLTHSADISTSGMNVSLPLCVCCVLFYALATFTCSPFFSENDPLSHRIVVTCAISVTLVFTRIVNGTRHRRMGMIESGSGHTLLC